MFSTGPQASNRTKTTGDMQAPFDAAVIIPTVLRETLLQAVRSVFTQEHPGRIQILIGVDVAQGDRNILRQLADECPDRMAITIFDPGYSTAKVHGGIYQNAYSGSLRTVMSYAANSARLAYLDDDNWWAPHHLGDLLTAIDGFDWAFTYRWFVDGGSRSVLCVDDFESIGPNRGIYKNKLGGFIDANCLMIDKTKCHWVLPHWSIPMLSDGSGEDRNVFSALKRDHSLGWTRRPSVYYAINPNSGAQPVREKILADRGLKTTLPAQGKSLPYVHRDNKINEYLLSNITRKLHIGAGPNILEGWLNTDISPHHDAILALDATTRLPFDDATFDAAFCEHMIEHLTLRQGLRFIGELFRVIRPGGVVRLATPDLMKIMSLFTSEPDDIQKKYVDWTTRTFIGPIDSYNPTLVLNNMFYNWGHRFIYNRTTLASALTQAGFADLKLHAAGESERPIFHGIDKHGEANGAPDMAFFETMVIEATKPEEEG